MPRYRYRYRSTAVAAESAVAEGYQWADNAQALAIKLRQQGLIPLQVEVLSEQPAGFARWHHWQFGRQRRDLPALFEQLASLLQAGVSLVAAIHSVAAQHHSLAPVLQDIVRQLHGGRDLASALRAWPAVFSTQVIAVLEVAQSTGRLAPACAELADYLAAQQQLRAQLWQRVRYPAVVFALLAAAVALIQWLVIPAVYRLLGTFKQQLPWATQWLLDGSAALAQLGPWLLVLLPLAVLGLWLCNRSASGRWHWHRLLSRLPLLGELLLLATLSRFGSALASALNASVPMLSALQLASLAVGNDFLRDRLLRMPAALQRGDDLLTAAGTTGVYSPASLQLFAVAEQTAAVGPLMQQLAAMHQQQLQQRLQTLLGWLQPILLLALTGLVLLLALGVMLPLWGLTGVIR